MSSRLALDANGRRIVVQTTPDVGLDVGERFLVLGDALPCNEPGFVFTGTRTRPRAAVSMRTGARVPVAR